MSFISDPRIHATASGRDRNWADSELKYAQSRNEASGCFSDKSA